MSSLAKPSAANGRLPLRTTHGRTRLIADRAVAVSQRGGATTYAQLGQPFRRRLDAAPSPPVVGRRGDGKGISGICRGPERSKDGKWRRRAWRAGGAAEAEALFRARPGRACPGRGRTEPQGPENPEWSQCSHWPWRAARAGLGWRSGLMVRSGQIESYIARKALGFHATTQRREERVRAKRAGAVDGDRYLPVPASRCRPRPA